MYYLLLLIALIACSKEVSNPSLGHLSPGMRTAIEERVTSLEETSNRCNDWEYAYPAKLPNGDWNDCGDGDGTLFNGVLCYSGYELSCRTVKDSLTPYGRLYRSPRRAVLGDTQPTASRDMFIGLLLYLVTTKDTETAKRWWAEVEKQKGLCLNLESSYPNDEGMRGEGFNLNPCDLTPGNYGLVYYVWGYLGLPQTDTMKSNRLLAHSGMKVTARFTNESFALHLVALQVLILHRIGKHNTESQAAVDILIQREPDNLLFQYVRNGTSENLGLKFLEKAPISPVGSESQWSFERFESEKAYEDSMGWEFVALGRLLLNE